MKRLFALVISISFLLSCEPVQKGEFEAEEPFEPFEPPVSFEEALEDAEKILKQMTFEEKIEMIGGHNVFFTKGFEKYGIPSIRFSDATQGISLVDFNDHLSRSVAFPAPIALASSWNRDLSRMYARSIGEECRAGGIGVLLGPGMNMYRISQCGRNFEYFGEDPFLAARMVENYVVGLQSTGTIATLKHFVANNSDFRRRTSNSVLTERALHEIYLPAFEAGIDAGAMAVMTAYNQVNGQYAAENKYLVTKLLRRDLGFQWLVMSDWLSIWNARKALRSGIDLDMPGESEDGVYHKDDHEKYLKVEAPKIYENKELHINYLDRMVLSIMTTFFAMESNDHSVKDLDELDNYEHHVDVAVQTAREGTVLLKNAGRALPLIPAKDEYILVTGDYADKLAVGGGAAYVEGYDHVTLLDALKDQFEDKIRFSGNPSDVEIARAYAVIYAAATYDSEGSDVPFDLPDELNGSIKRIANFNPRTIIVMYTGGGKNMTSWNDDVSAILYSWYPGQAGNIAVAEIISGAVNPSGKLPITIERDFKDSPGYPYLPEGEELYTGWEFDFDMDHPVHDINYYEEIFMGYRWYEFKDIDPLYAFGHGLSYSDFEYSNLTTKSDRFSLGEKVPVKIDITNSSDYDGFEIIQLYVKDAVASVPRPEKELKDFKKIYLAAGQTKTVHFTLTRRDFAFWDEVRSAWKIEKGDFEIMVGSSSDRIHETTEISMW